jgi:hypothetical protein
MTTRLLTFVLLLVVAAAAYADRITLDFRKGHNLKLVYDAGLRPWRVTASTCMVGGNGPKDITRWTIILPSGEQFDYASSMASFSVLEDFDIASIGFSGVDDVPIPEAVALTKSICTAMKLSTDGLDAMIARLDDRTRRADYWTQDVERAKLRFHIVLELRRFFDHTSAQVGIDLRWRDFYPEDWSKAPLKHLIRDLKPPPGYEGASMAPPPSDPKKKPFPDPAFSLDAMKRKIDEEKKRQGK